MSLFGLNGPATSTNAAYEIVKGRKRHNIDYDLVVQGQPLSHQFQSGGRGYEVPSPPRQFRVVAPSQDKEGGAKEEVMYEHIPGN